MNLNQMAFRCPDAQVVDTVRLEGYRLAFRMNGGGHGVATILPEPDSFVERLIPMSLTPQVRVEVEDLFYGCHCKQSTGSCERQQHSRRLL